MILKNKYVLAFCFFTRLVFGQQFIEPDQLKHFNITVNHDDYTVKTQILSQNKAIKIDNERTYMWFGAQKIMETKGGFEGRLIHGKYSSFYLNNQLKEQGVIKYGLRNKQWKYWYPDGNLREIITWKNGIKNGPYSLYNDYGQLMAKSSFKNDKLNGKFYTYGANGSVTDKKKYKNGTEIVPKIKAEKPAKEEKPKKEKKPKEIKPGKEKKHGKKKNSSDTTETEKPKIITS